MSDTIIKKYPIYYKNKKYEIRIEKEQCYGSYINFLYEDYINIYEVYEKTKCILNYSKVYSKLLHDIKCKVYELKNELNKDEDYYIKLFKQTFKDYIEPKEIEENQLAALNNWDGVIEDV